MIDQPEPDAHRPDAHALGPGERLWRLDAATRVEAAVTLADRRQPDAAGRLPADAAADRALTEFAAGNLLAALDAWDELIGAVGGESAGQRDDRWADIMLGLAVLTRAAGDHDRTARVLRRLDRALPDTHRLRVAWLHARALHALAQGSLEHAATAAAATVARATQNTLEHAAGVRAVGLVALAAGRVDEASQAFATAADAFDALGLTLAAAACIARRAAAEALAARDHDAWTLAVGALGRFDVMRYRVLTPHGRAAWLDEYADTLAIALELAERAAPPAAKAELVERARTQVALRATHVHPVNLRGEASESARSFVVALEDVRPLAVGAHAPVLTGTPARRDDPPIDLDAIRRGVGGNDAWWWGSWRWRDTIHWALIAPDGVVHGGSNDASTLPFDADAQRAALDGDPRRERAFARVVGRAVVPPPLVRAASEALARGTPRLRIVVAASAAVGGLPLASAAIETDHVDDEGGEPRRLIEAADLVVAPSAGFVDQLAHRNRRGRHRRAASPHALRLVVADPFGDLPIARRTATRLGARYNAKVLLGADATSSAIRHALANEETSGGTLAVMTHAVAASIDGAILELAPGDPDDSDGSLGARYLVHASDWDLGERFASRVLLAACSSSGVTSLGAAGEWLAVAPALLHCGADVVIATSWPQPEHPATEALDAALVDALVERDDAVAALADVQREWLARWRASGWETSAEQAAGRVAADHASPLLWAGLLAVSAAAV